MAGYVLFTVLAVYTHNLAWTVVVTEWAIFVRQRWACSRFKQTFLKAQCLIMVLFVPWLGGLWHHVQSITPHTRGGDWSRAAAAAFVAIANFLSGFWYYLQASSLHALCLLTVCVAAVIFFCSFTSDAEKRPQQTVMLLSFSIPFAMSTALSWRTGMNHSKYFFPAFVPLMWIMGCGLERLRERRSPLLPVYLAMLFLLTAASYQRYYGPEQAGRDPWREISAHIARQWQEDDLAVFNGPFSFYPFVYYTHGALRWVGMPQTTPPSLNTVEQDFRRIGIGEVHHIFLVNSPGSQLGIDPRNTVLQWLRENTLLSYERAYGAIQLYCFTVNSEQGETSSKERG